jgi:ribonuclease P protein subunit POP4
MITPKDLVRHELVGLDVEIASSSNPSTVGIRGKVADESRNTISIETAQGITRTAIKDQCTFVFTLPSGERVRVDGRLLLSRPEDRVKKRHKKW